MTSAYLRYPHVRQDLVAFVAADDVWVVGAEGGRAWRVTDDRAPVRQPRISPDGHRVAFVSYRDGHPELVVADLEGGPSRRLTYWGGHTTLVLGWADDERVLVAANAGEASIRHLVVKAVGLDGRTERLRHGPASGLALAEDGAVALATPGSRPPAHWKRYRGGTAPRLWLDRGGDGRWERLLPEETAGLVDPMWVDGHLVVVSDRAAALPDRPDEQANLWVWDGTPEGEPRQLTHQGPEQGYVRDAATDGHRVVWHSRGRLWLLDGLDADGPRELKVTVPGSAPQRWSARSTERLHTLAPDHGGDASLVGWRGATFWLAHREGPARALVADSAVRTREPVLLGRTGRAALVTDAEGEDAVEVHHVSGAEAPRRLAAGRLGRVLHLASDPDGARLAAVTHDGRVLLLDVPGGTGGQQGKGGKQADGTDGGVRQVGHSPQGEAECPGFSPDGRYLLWSQPTAGEAELHQVMVLDTRDPGAEPVALTSGRYHDHDPAFTRDGRYVVMLSERTFDPEYDPHEFALSFAGSTRPWLVPLSATEPAPFGPSAEGWRLSRAEGGRDDGQRPRGSDGRDGDQAAEHGEPPVSPDLDVDGAEDRLVPFPVPSGDYRDLRPAKDGVLWVEQSASTGELGSRRAGVHGEAEPDRLRYWSFARRTVETVVDKVDHYAVSGDGERVVVRHRDTVTVSPATQKPEEEDPAVVTVDLGRMRLEVDPLAEWRQMFEENARLMRDHFWRADMDGVDWDAVVARWRPVVEQLRSADDMEDLLWEVGGELNTSHAYAMPPEPPGDQDRRLGLLAAELSPADEGWRIDRVLPGESSEPQARSPLRAAGVDARPGDLVVSVDGHPVDRAHGPAAQLVGAAGKPVELTLRREGTDRRVVVVPLADEEVIRYQDWVRSRREYVRERSGGRLGYLHVPDMTSYGWAQLHRDLRHATRAEGLIADVRYNRGGHTSQLVIARLAARVVAWATGRHYAEPATYPTNAPRGPVVLVANEFSGSDGDIVNAAAQALGVGPVVGVRTWGGVVGIDGRYDLVDGTVVTQPRYAFWLQGKEWGVENHGVDPDIEVPTSPADFFAEEDVQLDRAVEEALRRLAEAPAAQPPPLPEPKARPRP